MHRLDQFAPLGYEPKETAMPHHPDPTIGKLHVTYSRMDALIDALTQYVENGQDAADSEDLSSEDAARLCEAETMLDHLNEMRVEYLNATDPRAIAALERLDEPNPEV